MKTKHWLYTYDGDTERLQIGGTELVDGDEVLAMGSMNIHLAQGHVVAVEVATDTEEEDETTPDVDEKFCADVLGDVEQVGKIYSHKYSYNIDVPTPIGTREEAQQVIEQELGTYNAQIPADLPPSPRKKAKVDKTPTKAPKARRGSSYDVTAMIADIKSGMKPAKVAEKHGVTTTTVYNVKKNNRALLMIRDVRLPDTFGLMQDDEDETEDQAITDPDLIAEIKERRSNGETNSEIAAVMELTFEQVAAVPGQVHMHDDRPERRRKDRDAKLRRLVNQGCTADEIRIAYPDVSLEAIEDIIKESRQ